MQLYSENVIKLKTFLKVFGSSFTFTVCNQGLLQTFRLSFVCLFVCNGFDINSCAFFLFLSASMSLPYLSMSSLLWTICPCSFTTLSVLPKRSVMPSKKSSLCNQLFRRYFFYNSLFRNICTELNGASKAGKAFQKKLLQLMNYD